MQPDELEKFAPVRNRWVGPFLWQSGLLRSFRQLRPRAVIVLGDSAHISSWVLAAVARVRNIPVLYWTIGWHRPERGVKRLYRLAFYRLANRLMLYGNHGRAIGEAMGYPPDRMGVIYNSSSSNPSSPAAERVPSPGGTKCWPSGKRPILGAVTRLQPTKQLHLIIEAAAGLRRLYGIEVDVLLVGEGPSQEYLRRRAAEVGVALFLPGPAYADEELRRVYNSLRVTVLPTLAGLAVIQSLKHGVPVVTHDNPHEQVPEFEAVVPGVTGGLYQYGNLDSLIENLREWLDWKQVRANDVHNACRAVVAEHWNPKSQARAIQRELNCSGSGSKS